LRDRTKSDLLDARPVGSGRYGGVGEVEAISYTSTVRRMRLSLEAIRAELGESATSSVALGLWVSVAMHDLPLTVLAPADGRLAGQRSDSRNCWARCWSLL
jgi:hypothetical protein